MEQQKVELDCETWVGESILVCPMCGSTYLHQGIVEVFDRNEDAAQGMHTVVSRNHTDVEYGPLTGNPSGRRQGLIIAFLCEECGNLSMLEILQHKGETFVRWGKQIPPAVVE